MNLKNDFMIRYTTSVVHLLAIILIFAIFTKCTDEPKASSSNTSSDTSLMKVSPPATLPKTDSVLADSITHPLVKQEKPDPITGKWKILMGRYAWTVRLTPRPKLKGEYAGTGTRDVRDENGKIVTMEIGAALTKNKFKAWVGPGVIIGEGRFNPTGVIEGKCIIITGEDGGLFKAERIPVRKN